MKIRLRGRRNRHICGQKGDTPAQVETLLVQLEDRRELAYGHHLPHPGPGQAKQPSPQHDKPRYGFGETLRWETRGNGSTVTIWPTTWRDTACPGLAGQDPGMAR
jgi:hypothetical protein